MAITISALNDLIEDARTSRESIEAKIQALLSQVQELADERDALRTEEENFRSSLARRFPTAASEPTKMELDGLNLSNDDDWSRMTRIDAVEKALIGVTAEAGSATPGDVLEVLHSHGRNDTREAVSGAIAYLNNRSKKIVSAGYGKWIAPRPSGRP